MANNGGPMYPFPDDPCGPWCPGISVRDGFAKELLGQLYPSVGHTGNSVLAHDVYDMAQAMTDEKLRRDEADCDEGKPDDGKG